MPSCAFERHTDIDSEHALENWMQHQLEMSLHTELVHTEKTQCKKIVRAIVADP
jgi:hypothetical protein